MSRDRGLQTIIKAVAAAIKGSDRKAENLRGFARHLYSGGSLEDLSQYSPGALAEIAKAGWKVFAAHRPGRFHMRIVDVAGFNDSTFALIANDDMPFLVDSVLALLTDIGHYPKLVLHPLFAVTRNTSGAVTAVVSGDGKIPTSAVRESFMVIELGRIAGEDKRKQLSEALASVLSDVRTVVLDWEAMMKRLRVVIDGFKDTPPPVPVDELAESIQFLEWLVDHNFTFLGQREFRFKGNPHKSDLVPVEDSGLGILRDPEVHVLRRAGKLVAITPEVREFLLQPAPIIITKANVRGTVHRRVHMDYIGVKKFDERGKLNGELRIVGLFTSTAYNQSAIRIPLLRRKVAKIVEDSGMNPDGHSGKALQNVLETYPRDELFQVDPLVLGEIAEGIRQLGERPRTRLFVRRDKFDRFVSCLIYVPRDQYNTTVRMRIGDLLARVYEGRVSAYYPSYPEGALARIHFIIGRDEGKTPTPDLEALEAQIAELALTWDDRLRQAIFDAYDIGAATELADRYIGAFSGGYREAFEAGHALSDISKIERLKEAGDIEIEFYRLDDDDARELRLKIFHLGGPIALTDRLPILEAMGLRAVSERSYSAELRHAPAEGGMWLHDIALQASDAVAKDFAAVRPLLEESFLAVWQRQADNDGFNALVLRARMPWREVAFLRAYAKYLRQVAAMFSQRYMAQTLTTHSGIAALLRDLFAQRFDPAVTSSPQARDASAAKIIAKIEEALAGVSSLDEDRIIRRFLNAIVSTLRTNAYSPDQGAGDYPAVAFKIQSAKVDYLPEPRPYAEIFVYAPQIEGVHLRGGMIARGGLRWSDRPEDFRTEVLGLVKAQQVKNAVIVPVGSKGGFVPKLLPAGGSREEIQNEAIRCYRTFISNLLSLTDNLKGTEVIAPSNVLRYDGDDPYLVVAADKGTATFSDIANGISEDHGFWLGDAFASGGSAGYDHKKMGITARGGWEAVKRHFREMDTDIQTTPFTVIGVGDMSGDVFGNGMLLSKHIKLVAAFDHRDIFIDPDPDPAKTFAERKRLFALGRSSWQDYNKALISKGGGIFPRSLKSIPLSEEIRALTGLKGSSATPIDLIRALLKSKADLLWFGGIGTYIRASEETDDDAGDRANDALRITASELKVKVIGEGANLGITQRARIEFAARGGRVNTDAIDNSAGVNSSDLEVNIKVALGAVETAGKLTRPDRNKLLAAMTGEVAALVLRNNYRQTLAISVVERLGTSEISYQSRMMRSLEQRGLLNREIEFLPDDLTLAERNVQNKPLTRPELSVLLAYAKITLYDDLLASGLPDDPYLAYELTRYFPARLTKQYGKAIETHRLRREIIATMLANGMINRGGPTFVSRMSDETGVGSEAVGTGYIIARESFDLLSINDRVDALDNKLPGDVQLELYTLLQNILRRRTAWFITNVLPVRSLDEVIGHYREGIETVRKSLPKILPEEALRWIGDAASTWAEKGVPAALAERIAALGYLIYAPDIIIVAGRVNRPIAEVARGYFMIGNRLRIYRLAQAADDIEQADYFERLAVNRARDGLFESQRMLAAEALGAKGPTDKVLDKWLEANAGHIDRCERRISELLSTGEFNLAKLTVATSYMRDLLQA